MRMGFGGSKSSRLVRLRRNTFKGIFLSYLTNVDEVLSTVDRVVLEEMNQELLRLFSGRR